MVGELVSQGIQGLAQPDWRKQLAVGTANEAGDKRARDPLLQLLEDPATWGRLVAPTAQSVRELHDDLVRRLAKAKGTDEAAQREEAGRLVALLAQRFVSALHPSTAIAVVGHQLDRRLYAIQEGVAVIKEGMGAVHSLAAERAAAWRERCIALPPPVCAALERVGPPDADDRLRLLNHLDELPAADVVEDLVETPPTWLRTTVPEVWEALGEYAEAHGHHVAAAAAFARVAREGGRNGVRWLARAALAALGAEQADVASALLEEARGRRGGESHPLLVVAQVLADPEHSAEQLGEALVAVSADSPDSVRVRVMRAMLHGQHGEHDQGLAQLEDLVDRPLAAPALLSAQLLLSRAVQGAPGVDRRSDLERAKALALLARDRRRAWNGASAEAVAVAAAAAFLTEGDAGPAEALRLGTVPPDGEALPSEAGDAQVRAVVADAKLLLGETDLGALPAEPEYSAALREGLRLTRSGESHDLVAVAYRRALAAAGSAEQAAFALQGLASLNALDDREQEHLSRLTVTHPELAGLVLAEQDAARGDVDAAVARLRPRAWTDRRSFDLLIQLLSDDERTEQVINTLLDGYGRFHDPGLAVRAAGWLLRAGDAARARQVTVDAFAQLPEGTPHRRPLLEILLGAANELEDWQLAERTARRLLELTGDPSWQWTVIGSLAKQDRLDEAFAELSDVELPAAPAEQEAVLAAQLIGRCSEDHEGLRRLLVLASRWTESERAQATILSQLVLLSARVGVPDDFDQEHLDRAMATFFERFPDSDLLRRIVVDRNEHSLREQLQDELFEQLERRRRLEAQLLPGVRAGTLPLGMLAAAFGKPLSEAYIRRAGGYLFAVAPDDATRRAEDEAALTAFGSPVVADLAAVHLLALLEDATVDVVLGAFASVALPEPARRDVSATVAAARLDTTGDTLGLDGGEVVVVPSAPGAVDHVAGMAQRMASLSERLLPMSAPDSSMVEKLDGGHPERREGYRSWLGVVSAAQAAGRAVYSDDVALRALARGQGVATFGTVAVLRVLGGAARLQVVPLDTALVTLRRNWVVDLPIERMQIQRTARKEEWAPGAASAPFTRPAFWAPPADDAIEVYRALLSRVAKERPNLLPQWVAAAATGLAAASGPGGAAEGLGVLVLEAYRRERTTFPAVLAAVRAVSTAAGAADPLPSFARHLRDIAALVPDVDRTRAERHVHGACEGLSEADRAIVADALSASPT